MDATCTALLFVKLIWIQKPWTITRIDMEPQEKPPERMERHVYVNFFSGGLVCGEA